MVGVCEIQASASSKGKNGNCLPSRQLLLGDALSLFRKMEVWAGRGGSPTLILSKRCLIELRHGAGRQLG